MAEPTFFTAFQTRIWGDFLKNKYSIIIIPPDHEKGPQQIQFSLKTKKVILIGVAAFGLFFSGLFFHDIYQARFIDRFEQKIAYLDQLEKEIQLKNMEIARLNGKTTEINENLQEIASLEKKIQSILKFNSDNSSSIEPSRGAAELQSYTPANTLDQAAALLNNQLEAIEGYYDDSVKFENKLDHTPSILPVNGPISSDFGYRRNPFGGWSREFHNGIDIACDYNTPVLATADGRVTFAAYDGYWGRKVQINHGFGVVTFYAHNAKLIVKVGDEVKKGQVIAYSGNSGRSTGSHLHYTAYVNGELVDPLVFTTYSKEQ